MKVIILAGGLGTRLGEETDVRPKPMVEIGGRPILWHIMKSYAHYGFTEFVVLLGYKGYLIKEYFANYFLYQCDVTVDLQNNSMEVHQSKSEPWKVTLIDTGLETQTGGRVLRARPYIGNEPFMLTYGDGVANVDLGRLLDHHRQHGRLLTMTTVQPEGRFGAVDMDQQGLIREFREKPPGDDTWINAGFMVCEPGVLDAIGQGDDTIFERTPLESLARNGQLAAYRHYGFWKCMDTLRDKLQLNALWNSGQAPWKLWE